jgi:anti-anti-sigma factor
MQVTALIRIHRSPGGTPPRAIRTLLQAARRIRSKRGFLRWQTFRTMDASDTLLVLMDWTSDEALRSADLDQELPSFRAIAAAWGLEVEAPEVLPSSFERRLSYDESVSTLLRLSRISEPQAHSHARDNDMALQALAAPGSTRLSGARNKGGTTAICRIDFDSEDGVWHFLESPLRRTWTSRAELEAEQEVWALNLPRLEYHAGPESLDRLPRRDDTLNVQLTVDEAKHTAELRLHGCVDAHGSAQCEKLCQVLMRDGCMQLRVDVSELKSISPLALDMLARTARALKERGGTFTLLDNDARVKRITRAKHLEISVRGN